MFDILFGWRKASKCKKLIKLVRCRLKLLKNKRSSIVKQIREDVAQLIKIGYEDVAFKRVDRLFKDESMMAAYELLDNFCDFIILHLSYIRRHKDCPNDINEAMSSLIFASARCGDLPELCAIRKLFGERYGERFEKTALELLPGNLVNSQVIEKLSIVSVTDDTKERLVDEIAREHCVRSEILAVECPSELQQQVSSIEEPQMQVSNANEIEESQILASSPESLPHISEDMIVYLDDIEEVPSSIGKEESVQDQRIFKFKSSPLPRSGKIEDSPDESLHTVPSSISSRKKEKATRKRSRFRAVQYGNSRMEDDYFAYYDSRCKLSPMQRDRAHPRYKHQRKNPEAKIEEPGDAANPKSQLASIRCSNHEGEGCYYFCTDGGTDNQKASPWKQKTGLKAAYDLEQKHTSLHFHQCHSPKIGKSKLEIEHHTLYHRPSTRSCELGNRPDYNARPDCQPDELSKTAEGKKIASPNVPSPLAGRQTKAPFSRTMTMPQERPKDSRTDYVARSKSFPIQSPGHVHPKLPDYDDISAKFMAFKREYLQKRTSPEAVA